MSMWTVFAALGSRRAVYTMRRNSALQGAARGVSRVVALLVVSLALVSGCAKADKVSKSTDPTTASESARAGHDQGTSESHGAAEAESDQAGSNGSAADVDADAQQSSTEGSGAAVSAGAGSAGEARGSITVEEPVKAGAGELPAVSFDSPAKPANGVTVRLVSVKSQRAEAVLPGETSGPAVLATVELKNQTSKPIDLDAVAVLLKPFSGVPALTMTDRSLKPFSGVAAPNSTASGQYLFRIDPEMREGATFSVKFAADAPAALFKGDLPNG